MIPLLLCMLLSPVPYSLHWEGAEIENVHSLFLTSFLANYQNLGLTSEDLGTEDINHVLEMYWIEEKESLKRDQIRSLVVKSHDEIVGYISFDVRQAPEEVVIRLLCVKPSMQGRGIGRSLVQSVDQIVPRVRKVTLITRRSNTSAIQFYKKLGFQEVPFVNKEANIDIRLCVQLEKTN